MTSTVRSSEALAAGFEALGRGRLILLLTFTTLVLGLLAAAPLRPALESSIEGTLAGDHLARGNAELGPSDAIDFLREESAAVHGSASAARLAALVGLLLQVFFAGGIVETIGRAPRQAESSYARAQFWSGSRRNFAHNLKCFLLFAVFAAILLGVWLAVAFGIGRAVTRNAPPHSTGGSVWFWISAAVALLLFGWLTLLYDFARAARRTSAAIGAFAAFGQARRRLRGRWTRGLGLLAFWSIAGAVSVGLLFAVAWGQRTPTGGAVALNLLLLAALVAARSAVRVGAWGSVLALYDGSEPPPPAPRPAVAVVITEDPAPLDDPPLAIAVAVPEEPLPPLKAIEPPASESVSLIPPEEPKPTDEA